MKEIFEKWSTGVEFLFNEYTVSFYSYFTTILVEIVIIWRFFDKIAVPFTCLLGACILNVCVSSWFKGICLGRKSEVIISRIYLIVFGIMFIIGCFINWLVSIILFSIPLVIAFLWIEMRKHQKFEIEDGSKIEIFINTIFANPLIGFLAQMIIVVLTMLVFTICISTSSLANILKICSIVAYAILVPFIVYIEDDFCSDNIFELAFENLWSDEEDENLQEFDENLKNNPEAIIEELEAISKYSGMSDHDSEEALKILEELKNEVNNNK